MGRKSVDDDKNIYWETREQLGLSRNAAAGELHFSASKLEKIEKGEQIPTPEDVFAMAECYRNPYLCNYYCTSTCAIGENFVPPVESKSFERITLELLSTASSFITEKDRLIEIAADGRLTAPELDDMRSIYAKLEQLSGAIENLKLWIEQQSANGQLELSKIRE